MRARAGAAVPAALLLLLLASLLAGCRAGPAAPAAAAAPQVLRMVTVAPSLGPGIPVTGYALELASCDPKGTFLNLRLSDALRDDGAAQLQVELNGRPAQCHHPLGDTSILSCTIPPLTMFPVLVVVRMDDAVIWQFDYDSALCPVAGQEQGGQNGYVPVMPTPTVAALEQATRSAGGRPAGAQPGSQPTPTPLPTGTLQPPSAQPSEPPPTEPPPTEPPPTQKSEPTPKSTPTHKPQPTPKPTHTDKPPSTEPPPTQPAPTEPAPTQSG